MKRARSYAEPSAPVVAPVPGHEGDAAGSSDAAYTTIGTGSAWEMLSLGCFAFTLILHYLPHPDWLYSQPKSILVRLLLPFAWTAGFSVLGIALGLVGSRRSSRPGLARLGVFLNTVVLALVGLLLLGIIVFVRR